LPPFGIYTIKHGQFSLILNSEILSPSAI